LVKESHSKMSDDEGQQFETNEAVGSDTFPMQCSALRKNGFVIIGGRPCKIVDMSTSKTGKHGHAKVNLTALDIFTGKKMEDMCPSTHNMLVPNVSRTEYQLLDISEDNFLSLLLPNGETKDDVRLPEDDLGDRITAEFEAGKAVLVSILKAMGEEAAVAYKENQ
jgi:translation initiation factor 5A